MDLPIGYCSNCDKQIYLKDKICNHCGAKFIFTDSSIKRFKKYLIGIIVWLIMVVSFLYFLNLSGFLTVNDYHRHSLKMFLLSFMIIASIGLIFGLIYLLHKNKKDKELASSGMQINAYKKLNRRK